MADSERKRVFRRWEALKAERSSWESHWEQLGQQVRPWTQRLRESTPNKGDKRHQSVINSTPTVALRTLAAGMMAGLTSPSRPWFAFTVKDPDLREDPDVKEWLEKARTEVLGILGASNLYQALHKGYSALGLYGTFAMQLERDRASVVRAYDFALGSYCLIADGTGRVVGAYRESRMTVEQVVGRWGEKAVRRETLRLYEAGRLDEWVHLLHVIVPNPDADASAALLEPTRRAWSSTWWECHGDDQDPPLARDGYQRLPILGPRWEVTGSDVYGESPGMAALGDCKALQQLERRKAQTADKIVDPPMKGDPSLASRRTSLLPGSVTLLGGPAGVYEPAVVVPPSAYQVMAAEVAQHERRIQQAFYADLFLLIAQADGQMTAREVAAREQEKLIQLGPVIERLQSELLAPLIEAVFDFAWEAGRIPPPPEEIAGSETTIDYLSVLAQASKLVHAQSTERLLGVVAGIAPLAPTVMDKLDVDQVVDELADVYGVPARVVRSDEAVDELRRVRAREQLAAQAAAQTQAAAGAAKDLAAAKVEDDNALGALLGG